MSNSTQEQIVGSDDQSGRYDGLVHVEIVEGVPGDSPARDLPLNYQPCDGSWAQFKSDIRRALRKARVEFRDRVEATRETWENVFHRNRPQTSNDPFPIRK